MAHYAKVVDDRVVKVIKCSDEVITKINDKSPGEWVKTSYNTLGGVYYDSDTNQPSADQSKALRKNYAGIGYSYDKDREAFIPPQPFPSWILNETSCLWNAPVAMPTDGKRYSWDEDSGSWVEVTAA
jgi:hypothetical protein